MRPLSRFTLVASITFTCIAGCSAPEPDGTAVGAEDDPTKAGLKSYGMALGVVAKGAEAKKLHTAIVAAEGTDLGGQQVLAGLTGLELGLAEAGDDGANEGFGILCKKEGGEDSCELRALVEMGKQPADGDSVVLTSKLAKAVARSLPRTSPAGLVGSATTGLGPVECKSTPGPTGSTCTIEKRAMVVTVHEMVTTGEEKMPIKEAKAMVQAFFPGN
jgi:hypothetical protein